MLKVPSESSFFSLVWSAAPLAWRQRRDFVTVIHHEIAYQAHGRRAMCVHALQCSSSCLTHHCPFKIFYPSVSSQADADSFLAQRSCNAAARGNQGPFPGSLGKLAFSSPVDWSSICCGSCESFNCFNIFFFLSSCHLSRNWEV